MKKSELKTLIKETLKENKGNKLFKGFQKHVIDFIEENNMEDGGNDWEEYRDMILEAEKTEDIKEVLDILHHDFFDFLNEYMGIPPY